MKRLVSSTLTLALAFALLAGPGVSTAARGTPPSAPPTDVWGAGPDIGTFLACVGCAAGGTMIALGGPASIFAAASVPGSVVAAAACVAACAAVAAS